jgi:hypothetical protein
LLEREDGGALFRFWIWAHREKSTIHSDSQTGRQKTQLVVFKSVQQKISVSVDRVYLSLNATIDVGVTQDEPDEAVDN